MALLIMAAILAPVAPADARPYHTGCHTSACHRRVARKAERREMRGYHRRPMPHCTWWGESGPGLPEWSMRRYRALNPSSSAGGKFQMLPSTFRAFGGHGMAHHARPVVQERIARRVLRGQGLGAWVLCH